MGGLVSWKLWNRRQSVDLFTTMQFVRFCNQGNIVREDRQVEEDEWR